jgi:hypothetical protein
MEHDPVSRLERGGSRVRGTRRGMGQEMGGGGLCWWDVVLSRIEQGGNRMRNEWAGVSRMMAEVGQGCLERGWRQGEVQRGENMRTARVFDDKPGNIKEQCS